MAEYFVELQPSAQKDLNWLASAIVSRIYPRLAALATNPRPPGCKKLSGGESEWRIRVGQYRIVYNIDDENRLVSVTRVRHRSAVYRP